MTAQLTLFAADRFHDPRVAADRARARSLAKLRAPQCRGRDLSASVTALVQPERAAPTDADLERRAA